MLGDIDTMFALQTVTKIVAFFLKAHDQCAGQEATCAEAKGATKSPENVMCKERA